MAKPAQGSFRFNAGRKYKFRGPHPASKEAKEHTKRVDAYIASLSAPKEMKQDEPAKPSEPSPEEAAKKAEARKKYLDELKSWRDD